MTPMLCCRAFASGALWAANSIKEGDERLTVGRRLRHHDVVPPIHKRHERCVWQTGLQVVRLRLKGTSVSAVPCRMRAGTVISPKQAAMGSPCR